MPDAVVAPAPDEGAVEHLAAEPERLVIVAAARRRKAACPPRGGSGAHIQSRCERRLANLP